MDSIVYSLASMWTAFVATLPIWLFIGFFAVLAILADYAASGCSNGDIDTAGRDQALRNGGHQ